MTAIERYRMTHRQIGTHQKEEFGRMAERIFAPNETTRDKTYLLPHLIESNLIRKRVDYEKALAELLKKEREVHVLDLGCGAGFWLEKQAQRDHRLEVYGISAKDYRHPKDRPLVVFMGKDGNGGNPIFKSQNGYATYVGIELDRTAAIDDEHYFIGDIHKILQTLPANFFHLVVSYQACRYLFDPLRVLKQIHRILTPQGYAFLESFDTRIQGSDGNLLTESQVKKLFTKSGLISSYGQYYPTTVHRKFGLAFKKKHSRLRLPIKYGQIVESPDDETRVITYELT